MRALPATVLLSALGLAACETPREACINNGLRELRTLNALIRETEGNIARGYAVEQDQEVEVRRTLCEYERDDGTTFRQFCDRTEVRDVERPVAIDLAQERRELAGLIERRDALAAQQSARTEACTAAYPE